MRVPTFLMTQTCTIKPYIGQTPSGPKYGEPYTSKCRFEVYRKKLTDDKGKEFIGNGRVFLPPDDSNINLLVNSSVTVDGVTYSIREKINQRGFKLSHVECVVV